MSQSDTNQKSHSGQALDDARKAGDDLAGSMRDTARDAVETTMSEASRTADKARDGAADEIKDVASALRTAAEEMRSGSFQDRAFSQIADSFADASDAVRDMELGEMLNQVNRFARRNPLVFLGGAALVGFAATRAAKASAEGSPQSVAAGQTHPAATPTAPGTATPGTAGRPATGGQHTGVTS